MKKVVVGVLASSLIFSQGIGIADAAGKTVRIDKDKNGIADDWQKKYHLANGKAGATKDNDGDGLSNLLEYQLNLNPTVKDTDKDKLPDGQEDYDKDSLTNLQDVQAKLDPALADSDKDGVKDAVEDNDSDELTTSEEFIVGTNPVNKDSDKDGLLDGEEDKDRDTLDNAVEFDYNFNPNSADSDRDGLRDCDEDFDGDGIANSNEVKELTIEAVNTDDEEFSLEYKFSKGKYKVEIEDEMGIANAATIAKQLVLTSAMTEEALIDSVRRAFGLENLSEIQIEVEFMNGKEIEAEDEFTVEDEDNDSSATSDAEDDDSDNEDQDED